MRKIMAYATTVIIGFIGGCLTAGLSAITWSFWIKNEEEA